MLMIIPLKIPNNLFKIYKKAELIQQLLGYLRHLFQALVKNSLM